jgi:DNA-binding NarL/FixJ family response regulator
LEAEVSASSFARVLVVDDYEPFRRFVGSLAETQQAWQIVGQAADGLEAVQKAPELQPDLILLDLGLPKLNGMEVMRRIRQLALASRILIVSQESSAAVAQEALARGARGYVLKSDAGCDLVPAVEAVLNGGVFVSSSLAGQVCMDAAELPQRKVKVAPLSSPEIGPCHHEVAFYRDDESRVDAFSSFIENALRSGSTVIVVASESHLGRLLARLRADGLDVGAAIKQRYCIFIGVSDLLPTFMDGNLPDPVRFRQAVGALMATAKGPEGTQRRVVACGECAPTLLAEGKAEAAIQVEHLWNEIVVKGYNTDTFCAYLSNRTEPHVFERICAEHSAIETHTTGSVHGTSR